MNIKLLFEALFKFFIGVLLVLMLIFIPAGTFNFSNGWLLAGILFIPMLIAGLIMFFKNPELLKSRLNINEKNKEQKSVVIISGLMFILGFIIAGLDFRYNWTRLPDIIVFVSSVIFLISYALYAEVLRENSFLLRTIDVKSGQTLIDTGLYRIVRHPMYFATLFLFLSIPLILGSLISFAMFMIYPFVIVRRIIDEERTLEKKLDGYKEYKLKVRYRLIPFFW